MAVCASNAWKYLPISAACDHKANIGLRSVKASWSQCQKRLTASYELT